MAGGEFPVFRKVKELVEVLQKIHGSSVDLFNFMRFCERPWVHGDSGFVAEIVDFLLSFSYLRLIFSEFFGVA